MACIASKVIPEHILKSTLLEFKDLYDNLNKIFMLFQERMRNKEGKIFIQNVIEFTKVKLVMVLLESETNIGFDLAAYLCPANATICPPNAAWETTVNFSMYEQLCHSNHN